MRKRKITGDRYNKYIITELIDVVSDNPKDYTRYWTVCSLDKASAIKKLALDLTREHSRNWGWVRRLEGTYEDLMQQLLQIRICFTDIKEG